MSGILTVTMAQDLLEMDFPARCQYPVEITQPMIQAVGVLPLEAYGGYNLTLVLNDAETIRTLMPVNEGIKALTDYHGVIVTAPGDDCDFVSRFFTPNAGVTEDLVTGSTYSSLVPYWSKRLHKKHLSAKQLSRHGGMLWCVYDGDRVRISGNAVLYSQGEILV